MRLLQSSALAGRLKATAARWSGSLPSTPLWPASTRPLRCVCYSGGKSLHGWYLVEGWPEHQCFELYAAAKGFGISDCATYSIRQPVRLPGGFNAKTKQTPIDLLMEPLNLKTKYCAIT